ncbi:MAG: hypothetical protein KDK89_05595 [Alphaproteobacteria bacterium]|nr:hypothetical protein [Alphaproteobacteria bacterium]
MSFYSITGALLFLLLGLLELALLYRILYPVLRWRFEKAKTTQTQGIEPNRIMALLKIQSLIILPIIGFVFGDRLKAIFG